MGVNIAGQQFKLGGFVKHATHLRFALGLLTVLLVPTVSFSQSGQTTGQPSGQMESSRSVAGGGVSVPGWTGKIDAKEEAAGMTLNSAKLVKEGNALHVTTGPAVTYWNPKTKRRETTP